MSAHDTRAGLISRIYQERRANILGHIFGPDGDGLYIALVTQAEPVTVGMMAARASPMMTVDRLFFTAHGGLHRWRIECEGVTLETGKGSPLVD